MALSISGTVFQNTAFKNLSHVLSGLGFSAEEVRGAIAGSRSALFESLDENVRAKAIEAIVKAIDGTYWLIVAGSALAIVAGLGLRWERLFMEVSTGGA